MLLKMKNVKMEPCLDDFNLLDEDILTIPHSAEPAFIPNTDIYSQARLTVDTSDSRSLLSTSIEGPNSLTMRLKKMKSPRPHSEMDSQSSSSGNNSDSGAKSVSKGSDSGSLGSNKKPKIKSEPKPHCVLCHLDFTSKNKVCIIQHELYEDKDVAHKTKPTSTTTSTTTTTTTTTITTTTAAAEERNTEASCFMVFCSYCKYKGKNN